MPIAVITGANSGIGYAFAKILINEGYEVFAADKDVGDNLRNLSCHFEQLDMGSQESIEKLANRLAGRPVDVLLNIAGMILENDQDNIETIHRASLTRMFAVNAFGPLLLTQALLPNVLAASNPRLGYMSSLVGSIGDNSSGGMYAYRGSKSALNSFVKNLAVELKEKNVVVVTMHPGIVETGLDPSTHDRAESIQPDEAAAELWKLFMGKTIEDTGKFWHREGQELPW